jgi:hypothetical protein
MRIQNDFLSNILGAASDIAIASPFVPNNALILANDTLQSVSEKTQGQIDAFIAASGVWAAYTPVFTATTTNPTLATTHILDGLYSVVGKVMNVSIRYLHTNAAGGTSGSGSYLVSIPGGYTIDTSLAKVPTSLTTTGITTLTGSRIGTGLVYVVNARELHITPGTNTTLFMPYINLSETMDIVGSATFPFTSASLCFTLNATFPIV